MRYDEEFISMPNAIRELARRNGELLAVRDEGIEWSFAELERQMIRAVRAVIALGVKPGDRVGLLAPNSANWILAALAIQGAGAIVIPLNTRFKPDELAYILGKGGASAIFAAAPPKDTHYLDALRAAHPELAALERTVTLDNQVVEGALRWEDFLAGADTVPAEDAVATVDRIVSDDVSDILFTSGTTGHPKGVMITHGQSLRGYGELGECFDYARGDRFLLIPPFFHALAYKSGWVAGFLQGAAALPERVFDARRTLERIDKEKISLMIGPPTIFLDLMNHPERDSFDLSSLRVVIPASTSISPDLIRRLKKELGIEYVLSGYGLTEASAIVSYAWKSDDIETIANSVGHPAKDVDVTIMLDDGSLAPTGETGEILVAGYNVMSGYWDDPAATAEAIDEEGRLHTGDIGHLDEEGILHITGRKKDIVIVGGFNAYPAEIEHILGGYPQIAEVAVVGTPDARMGEVTRAFVVPKDGEVIRPDELIAWAREKMANFKVPRYVRIVDSLPKNASMKVLKSELREEPPNAQELQSVR